MKVRELIKELLEFDMDADVTTPVSEDICIAYISADGEKKLSKKESRQIFIEPTDNCPSCSNNYMDDASEERWCSYYDKPCKDVMECYQYEDEFPVEYVEDRYEGWITKS